MLLTIILLAIGLVAYMAFSGITQFEALVDQQVNRLWSQLPVADSGGVVAPAAFRTNGYRELYVQPGWQDLNAQADEGTLWTATTSGLAAGTGIAFVVNTGFNTTNCAIIILNGETPGGLTYYPKRINCQFTVAPASGTAGYYTLLQSNTLASFSSGGTSLTLVNPNFATKQSLNAASKVLVGNATLASGTFTAPPSGARAVATGQFRTVIPVVGDSMEFINGGLDPSSNGGLMNGTNPTNLVIPLPPVPIPSQGGLAISLAFPANAVTPASFLWNVAFTAR